MFRCNLITHLSSHSACPQPGYVCLPLIPIHVSACIQVYLVKLVQEARSDLIGKVIVAYGEREGVHVCGVCVGGRVGG